MNINRFQELAIWLIAALAAVILFPASLSAQEVRLIYGTGFTPHNLKEGDSLEGETWIEADSETIVVLSRKWRLDDGLCEDWVILRGKQYQVETDQPGVCKEQGQGNELAQAMGGKAMVGKIRVFQFSDGKADTITPSKLASLHDDFMTLKEKSESEPPTPAEKALLAEKRHKAEQALLWGKAHGLGQGSYTIQQKSNGRYMDAHEGSHDNAVVTRVKQNNNTQRWILTPIGKNTYSIQQKSNGRYLDAHEGSHDNAVVTRDKQNNNTQRWILTPIGKNTYTVRQKSNGRYMDAHEGSHDNAVVTRDKQKNNTQRWIFKRQ